jgi:hypothetical protein
MNYFNAMLRVLKLDEKIYPEINAHGSTVHYAIVNIFFLCILYGFFSLVLLNVEFSPHDYPNLASVLIVKAIVILTGMLVAFLLHMGAALLLWTFGRGVGGAARFMPVYYNLGIAVVPLWLAIPGITALCAGWRGEGIYLFAICTSIYALASLFVATKSVFNLSNLKMSLAAAMMLIFVTSFLYLWL